MGTLNKLGPLKFKAPNSSCPLRIAGPSPGLNFK